MESFGKNTASTIDRYPMHSIPGLIKTFSSYSKTILLKVAVCDVAPEGLPMAATFIGNSTAIQV